MLNPYTRGTHWGCWPCMTFRIKCHEVTLFLLLALCTPPLLPGGDRLRRKPELFWAVMKCHCVILECLTYVSNVIFGSYVIKIKNSACVHTSTLHSSHTSSRHNSLPEINVLSRLKFSKSVFPHLMLVWAKRNQIILLEDTAAICSSMPAPRPPPSTSNL